MTGKLLLACALAGAVGTAGTAKVAHAQSQADKDAAKAAYKKGTSAYNLAQWDKAIKYFTEAFEILPDAAFLFNLAQTHRQADNCKDASFFYSRYLSMKPNAPNRAEIEGFIKELDDECARRAEAAALAAKNDPKPENTGGTEAGGTESGGTETGGTEAGGTESSGTSTGGTQVADASTTGGTVGVVGGQGQAGPSLADSESQGPSLLVAYASVGPSMMFAGDLELPLRSTATLSAGYPLQLGSLAVDVGALASLNVIPWTSQDEMSDGSVLFSSVLLNAGAAYPIMDKLAIRAELGLGLMVFSGLGEQGNGFSDPNVRIEDGSLAGFNARVALGAEYALTDSLAITAQPIVFSYAATPDGFDPGISNVSAIQAVFGVGYKM